MKKYLALALALGAIAFVSVSFLAQAEPQADNTTMMSMEKAPDDAVAMTPAVDPAAKDKEDCAAMAATPGADGAAPSEEAKNAAFEKCMASKGHGEDAEDPAADAPQTEDRVEE